MKKEQRYGLKKNIYNNYLEEQRVQKRLTDYDENKEKDSLCENS